MTHNTSEEAVDRTAEDTATDYKTVDLLRALLAERNRCKERAERAEAALKFYADDNLFVAPNDGPWGMGSTDFGKKARDILAQIDAEPTDDDTQAALDKLLQEARNEALREVINLVNGCDRVSEVQPAIENLITED